MHNYLFEWLVEYKDEYEINLIEGLNKTVELQRSLPIVKKSFNDAILTPIKDLNTFSLDIDNPSLEDINKIKSLIVNNLGWFISRIVIKLSDGRKTSGKWDEKILDILNKTESITFYFEAKYDYKIDTNKIPEYLYHITPKKYLDKILKVGLIPKTRSKMLFHPERVYLTKNIDDAEKLGPKFYQITGESQWSLLKITTGLIPGSYFQLYQDPNYKPNGYYTMNNIPSIAIEKIKDVNYSS